MSPRKASDDYILDIMAALQERGITQEQFDEHYHNHPVSETADHFGIPHRGIYVALEWWGISPKRTPGMKRRTKSISTRPFSNRRSAFNSKASREARAMGLPVPEAEHDSPKQLAQRKLMRLRRSRRGYSVLAPLRWLGRGWRRVAWEVAGFFHPEIPLGEAAAMRTRAERDNREATR